MISISNQTQSFGKAGVKLHRTIITTAFTSKLQYVSEKMRKPVKNQKPSFSRAGIHSYRVEAILLSSSAKDNETS